MDTENVLLVDLDDTLLNTSKIKEDFFNNVAAKTNYPKKQIEEIYKKTKNKNGYKNLLENFLKNIKRETKNDIKENLFYSKVKKERLNKDLILILEKTKGYKILLTEGDRKIQSKKIKKLGLKKIFNKIKILNDKKVKFITSRIKNEKFFINKKEFKKVMIVDDKAEEIRDQISNREWIQILTPVEFIYLSEKK